MSDDIQQTNWLGSIVIAVILASPGWYLYYDASTKTELDAKKSMFKIKRLEKQLETVRENAASDYSSWRKRFQDTNHALIAANATLQTIKSKLKEINPKSIANDDAANSLKVDKDNLMEQLEIKNKSNAELEEKLKERNSRLEILTSKLEQLESDRVKTQETLDVTQKANQKAESQIIQNSEELKGIASQADIYEKENLQYQIKNQRLSEDHAKLTLAFDQLKKALSQEVKKKDVEILTLEDNSTVIRLQSGILFESASALLKGEAKPALDQIAITLQNLPNQRISIEGHTDAFQIVGKKERHFISNWELSAARAAAAARYLLHSNKQLDATKIQIVGHGAYAPVADNATPEGRQLNRRIEIRVFSKSH